jgi:hypothetical protein
LAETLASDRLDRAINGWAKLRLAKPQKLGGSISQDETSTRLLNLTVSALHLSRFCALDRVVLNDLFILC